MTEFIMYVLPYVLVFGLGYVLGFMSRNGTVDKLTADAFKLRKALAGEEIRTSRTEPVQEPVQTPVRPVQPRTRTGHRAGRTEPLPTGVQYVAAAEGARTAELGDDEPVSDLEYARMHGRED